MLSYSVVITSYLRSELVKLSLESVLLQDRPPLEIIIVDNNVLERESDLLKKLIKNKQDICPIRIIKTPKNSAAVARYMGACASNGDLILFMDNDVVIESNYSSQLIKDFDGEIINYDETEFLKNKDIIISELLNRSLFESKKIILISRVTEKILKSFASKNIAGYIHIIGIIGIINLMSLVDMKLIIK